MATNGNGNGSSLQGWVGTIKALGITTVLSLGFFYWVTQSVDRKQDEALGIVRANAVANQKLEGMLVSHIDSSGHAMAEVLFYLRALCIQNARSTGQDPRDCVPPR